MKSLSEKMAMKILNILHDRQSLEAGMRPTTIAVYILTLIAAFFILFAH